MQQDELVEIRLYDRAVTSVPIGTLLVKVYYDDDWHVLRCFPPRETQYDRSADAERYKRELRFVGCGLPIEIECLQPEPIESDTIDE